MSSASPPPGNTAVDRFRQRRGRRRPTMRGGWAGPALLVMLALVILIGPVVRGPGRDALYLPAGYTRIVNELMRSAHPLIQAELDDDLNPRKYVPVASGDKKLDEQFTAFLTNSFLGTDMKTPDEAVWDTDSIQDTAHRQSGPTDNITPWTGDILFRTLDDLGSPLAMTPDGQVDRKAASRLELRDDRFPLPLALGLGNALAPACDRTVYLAGKRPPTGDGCRESDPAAKVSFIPGPDADADGNAPGGEGAAVGFDLILIGDQPVLHLFGADARGIPELRVNGAPIKLPYGGEDAEHYVPLAGLGAGAGLSRDITLDIQGRHFRIVANVPTVSRFRGGGGRYYWPGLENFAAPIADAMDGDASVPTSLVEEVQRASQRVLNDKVKELRGPSRFRAAAVLMDGLSGEIAALPSYPVLPAETDREDTPADPIAHKNSDFVNLPVGSTAKVPFAVAITQRYPELLGLRLNDPSTKFDCLMGWRFPNKATQQTDGAGNIDFRRFIAVSNNHYAFALMMLGLAEPQSGGGPFPIASASVAGCPGEQAWLGPVQPFRRPPFRLWDQGQPNGPHDPARPQPAGGAWSGNLLSLFCIVDSGQAQETDAKGCQPSLWPGQPQLQDRAELRLETIYLGMNRVHNLKTDYLMSVLGGSRSRWSIIRLAQSYARIVTDRTINARLTPLPQPEPAPLGIDPRVRGEVMAGMRDVFRKSSGGGWAGIGGSWTGTAGGSDGAKLSFQGQKLGDDIPVGDSVFQFYAKTGTPKVILNTGVDADADALIKFSHQPRCGFRAIAGGAGHRPRFTVNGKSGDTATLVAEIRKAPSSCDAFRQPERAGTIAREMLRAERLPGVVMAADGAIASIPSQAGAGSGEGDEKTPNGKVFSLVATRAKGGHLCTVSAIAVNFQAPVTGPSPAIGYTANLLKDPAVMAWLMRRGGACQ